MTQHKATVLITGASGMIGRLLTGHLQEKGYAVRWLVRDPAQSPVEAFRWSPEKNELDPAALEGTDAIINLAGESIASGRWTESRKHRILESRTKSTLLLAAKLKEIPNRVSVFLSASAIGYYGDRPVNELLTEDAQPGNDFLATVTREWEKAADEVTAVTGVRLVKVRIGIVLGEGGALKELAKPVRLMAGSPLGTGRQMMSWIHEDDLTGIFIHLLENSGAGGVFNAVAPNPVSNRVMVQAIGRALKKPVFLPPVPAFLLKVILGEMSVMVLAGNRISAGRILSAGYRFRFPDLQEALKDIFEGGR